MPEYRATACRSGVQAVNGVAGDPERVAGPTDGFPIYNPVMGGDSGGLRSGPGGVGSTGRDLSRLSEALTPRPADDSYGAGFCRLCANGSRSTLAYRIATYSEPSPCITFGAYR